MFVDFEWVRNIVCHERLDTDTRSFGVNLANSMTFELQRDGKSRVKQCVTVNCTLLLGELLPSLLRLTLISYHYTL